MIQRRRVVPPMIALVVLSIAWTGPSAAERERFWETTDVTVVEIPVQVLRDGRPVTGLTADDFMLFDGKKQQDLLGFDEINLSEIEAATTASTSTPSRTVVADLPAMGRRHFLFFFDLSFSEPASLTRAKTSALDLARTSLHPTDLAAVGIYSASHGARLMLGFTSDRRQIELAIETLDAPQLVDRNADALNLVYAEARQTAAIQIDAETGAGPRMPGGRGADAARLISEMQHVRDLAQLETQTRETRQRSSVTDLTRSFTDMADVLARVKGTKQVLYFSEGFNSNLMLGSGKDRESRESSELGEIWDVDGDTVFGNTGLQNDLQSMIEGFRRADAVIQAIDIGGVRAANNIQSRGDIGGIRIDGSPQVDRSVGQDGLFFMANETGGELFRNFNNLTDAMNKVLERTSVTYLLAFQPKDLLPDGSYRKVRVKLRKGIPNAKVVHRTGYFAPKLWSQQSSLEQRLTNADLILGRREAGSISLAVIATALAGEGEKAVVPYVVEIDGPSLIRAHRGDLLNGEIHIYAIDEQGTVHAFHNQMLGMNLAKTRDQLGRAGIKFCGVVALPPGRYDIRALVRNNGALTHGLSTGSVNVPDFALDGTPPPVFVEPSGDWVMLQANATGPVAPYPWMVDDEMWVPMPDARLEAGQRVTVWLESPSTQREATVGAQVRAVRDTSATGAPVTLAVTHREVIADDQRLLLDFVPSGLAPGAYVLEVALTPGSSSSAATSLPFTVDG